MDIVPFEEPEELAPRRKPGGLPPLSPEDMGKAERLAKGLLRSEDHLDDIVSFGDDAQAAMAAISKDMLRGVRVGTLDEIMRLSDDVTEQVQTIDIADLLPRARPILFLLRETAGMIKRRIQEFFRRFQLVNAYLDRQEAQIQAKEWTSTERFNQDKALIKASLQAIRDAHVKAVAISLFVDGECGHSETQHRLDAVSKEKENALAEGRSMDYLVVAAAERHGKYIERLEVKRSMLQKAMLTASQMNIASRMMADNENIIRQKLRDIRTDLLPQWRSMMALAFQAYEQHGITGLVKKLTAEEGRMRDATGKQIEATSEEIAAMVAAGILDVDAMRKYNQRLGRALNNLKTASVEAKKRRDQAEHEIQDLIGQLGDAVADAAQRKE